MIVGIILIILFVILVLFYTLKCQKRPGPDFPGGPPVLPIVGSVPFITRKFGDPLIQVRLMELSKK